MVRIIQSARRHGVRDADIHHALRIFFTDFQESDGITIVVGAARDGTLLEIGVRDIEDQPTVIHAMVARRKYLPRSRGN